MLALSKLAPTKKPIIMKLAVLVSSSESVESQPSLEKVVVDEATTSALTRHGNCLVCVYIYICYSINYYFLFCYYILYSWSLLVFVEEKLPITPFLKLLKSYDLNLHDKN